MVGRAGQGRLIEDCLGDPGTTPVEQLKTRITIRWNSAMRPVYEPASRAVESVPAAAWPGGIGWRGRFALACVALACVPIATAADPIPVSVDFNAPGRPISPLIFGVSFGNPARNAAIGYPLVRWGGNSVTRYNWQANVYNTANDYYFENIPNCAQAYCPPGLPQSDLFIAGVRSGGAETLLTIPTIGLTARADSPSSHPYFAGFSVARYGAQISTDPYDQDAGDGACDNAVNHTAYCVNGLIVGNSPADTSSAVTPAFEQQWIAHLQATYGTAAAGGVRLFALDNEIMLWNSTHRDVRPAAIGYDDAWANTSAYAAAIKQQDGAALVTGPVPWGYSDLWTSAADAASCGCLDGADRTAHGHLPFVAWYLQQVCANPVDPSTRLVDYLDLHYYPQGDNVYSSDDSGATAALRLRALRELYDAGWTSESWIGTLDGAAGDDPEYHYTKPDLIPRVRAWIDQYCPGTKLALTEYNWGEDGTTSGAVAQAELFGIFAREGVDLAARWVAPAAATPVEQAFALFLDYDGAGTRVSGDSAAASSGAAIDQVGAYAFRDYGRRNMVLLTNKDTSSHSVTLAFAQGQSGAWRRYGFDAANALREIDSGGAPGLSLSLTLPAMSANLVVLADDDGLFRDGFDN